MLNWSKIDTILLDMDGTLLDLHFDNYFWLHVVPTEHAKKQNISFDEAQKDILHRYEQVAGSIQWYCLDYWQQQLNLPIMELKKQNTHLITLREDVPEFLSALNNAGKELILLTNAHPNSLNLKRQHTELDSYLNKRVSTHEYGVAKESQLLWQQIEKDLGFDKQRTLFIDDSLTVLAAAKRFGIKHLLAVANPDSKRPVNVITDYKAITDFRRLLPI